MTKNRKLIMAGGIALVLLILLFSQITGGLEAKLIEIKGQTLVDSFTEQGTIIPRVERPLYIHSPQEVLEILVIEGQQVEKGEPLAILSTLELDTLLRQLEIQRDSLRLAREASLKTGRLQEQEALIQLDTLQSEFNKSESLYKMGALSKGDLEKVEDKLKLAQINLERQQEALRLIEANQELEALEGQIELLEYKIDKTKLLAPIDGIVSRINIKAGDLAQAGQPLMTVFQRDDYLIETFVPEVEARLLREDMKVLVKDQENTFEGQIKSIAPSTITRISPLGLEEERVKVTIDVIIPREAKLFAGAKVDLEFITALVEEVLVVPKTALFTYEGHDALWVVRKGKANIQKIKKGLETNHYLEIKEGLEENDQVIITPHLKGLKSGTRIIKSR